MARVRLVTYNVFQRPMGIHNAGGDYKHERLDALQQSMFTERPPDILCVQAGLCIRALLHEKWLSLPQKRLTRNSSDLAQAGDSASQRFSV